MTFLVLWGLVLISNCVHGSMEVSPTTNLKGGKQQQKPVHIYITSMFADTVDEHKRTPEGLEGGMDGVEEDVTAQQAAWPGTPGGTVRKGSLTQNDG